jgi:Kinesin motor domain
VRPAIVPNQLPSTPSQTSSDRPITRNSIKIIPNEPQVVIGREEASQKSFTFDYVYGPSSTQEEIYQELVEPLVGQFLQGFNATILA